MLVEFAMRNLIDKKKSALIFIDALLLSLFQFRLRGNKRPAFSRGCPKSRRDPLRFSDSLQVISLFLTVERAKKARNARSWRRYDSTHHASQSKELQSAPRSDFLLLRHEPSCAN
jgi:hypothetical protein